MVWTVPTRLVGVADWRSARLSVELGVPSPNPARTSLSYSVQVPRETHVLVRDEHGARVASGAYCMKLTSDGVEHSRKVMVIQ